MTHRRQNERRRKDIDRIRPSAAASIGIGGVHGEIEIAVRRQSPGQGAVPGVRRDAEAEGDDGSSGEDRTLTQDPESVMQILPAAFE